MTLDQTGEKKVKTTKEHGEAVFCAMRHARFGSGQGLVAKTEKKEKTAKKLEEAV